MSLPPSGEIPQGAIRFNTDSQKLEFYAQGEWWVMSTDTPNLGRSVDSTPGARGLTGGGDEISIEYINIASAGDAVAFGDLDVQTQVLASFGSSTRGFWAGGKEHPSPGRTDTIQTVVFASIGDTTDFGDLANGGRNYCAGCSNATRGLIGGGENPAITNNIEYVTMASTGTAATFGELLYNAGGLGATSSSTRGIFFGTYPGSTNINFVTVPTLGDAQDFGDTTNNSAGGSASTNGTRAVLALGNDGSNRNYIDYVTMTSTGNAVDFGDLTLARRYCAAMASSTRGVFAGGYANPEGSVKNNNVDYVEFATQGNAVDFGDLNTARGGAAGCSNAHGGL